ncbi:helix-turn-helix domain-containing protein [Streptomyces sp. NPDC051954]|uniref:helix-turn-helix domain-containing protein n=1 Tax=unclassified Streptomyces TaxID=2593676 RepID=UPI00344343B4
MTDTVRKELIEFTDTRPGYENRPGQFITVPKQVMRDPNLSDAERTILLYLHDRAGNPNIELYKEKDKQWCRIAFPEYPTIAEDTNRGVRQTKEIVKSLRIKGYLKISKRKTSKGENNLYQIQFPASYQALNNVNTFTLLVATGKNLVKDEITAEAGADTRTRPSADTRTSSSADTRTLNSSIESSSIETGTSTLLTQRSEMDTDSSSPGEDPASPLASTNTAFGVMGIPGEVDKELEEISKSLPLVDVVDAPASPTRGSFIAKKRIDRVPAPSQTLTSSQRSAKRAAAHRAEQTAKQELVQARREQFRADLAEFPQEASKEPQTATQSVRSVQQ